jgi:putative sterol carrier protein
MRDAATSFFEALGQREYEPLLDRATGTLRFEVVGGDAKDRWFVSVDKGHVSVSHARRKADCVIRGEKRLVEGILSGEVNAMAAALRGALAVEGNPELLVMFQRILPGPPSARGARSEAR